MYTLPQVQNWDTLHLEEAACHWNRVADWWEDSFTIVDREVMNPGGTTWIGDAASVAQAHVAADRARALEMAEALRAAANKASLGRDELDQAKRAVLTAVEAAAVDGFKVSDNWTVSDTQSVSPDALLSRQEQMTEHAKAIHSAVAEMTWADEGISQDINTSMSTISGLDFKMDTPPNPDQPDPVREFFEENVLSPTSLPPEAQAAREAAERSMAENGETPGGLPPLNMDWAHGSGCTTREYRDALAGFVGSAGGLGVGVLGARASTLSWAAIAFGAITLPGSWENLMQCVDRQ